MKGKTAYAIGSIIVVIVVLEALSYAGLFGSVVWHGSREDNVVFLTFDDGPSENTVRVLEILSEHKVKATFFLLGENVKRHPETAQMIVREGHDVGIHSMTHPRLWRNVSAEIKDSKSVVEKNTNRSVAFFRPPYGFVTPVVSYIAGKNNLTLVMWDVFPYDYKHNRDEIVGSVIEKLRPGSIIVLHDGPGNRGEMLAALPDIIRNVKEKGYRFGLLKESQ